MTESSPTNKMISQINKRNMAKSTLQFPVKQLELEIQPTPANRYVHRGGITLPPKEHFVPAIDSMPSVVVEKPCKPFPVQKKRDVFKEVSERLDAYENLEDSWYYDSIYQSTYSNASRDSEACSEPCLSKKGRMLTRMMEMHKSLGLDDTSKTSIGSKHSKIGESSKSRPFACRLRYATLTDFQIDISEPDAQKAYFQLMQACIFREASIMKVRTVVHNLDNQYWRYSLMRVKAYRLRLPHNVQRLVSKQKQIRKLQEELSVAFAHLRSISMSVVERLIRIRNLCQENQKTDFSVSFFYNGSNYLLKMLNDLDFLQEFPVIRFWMSFELNPFLIPPENNVHYSAWHSNMRPQYDRWIHSYKEKLLKTKMQQQRGLHQFSKSKRVISTALSLSRRSSVADLGQESQTDSTEKQHENFGASATESNRSRPSDDGTEEAEVEDEKQMEGSIDSSIPKAKKGMLVIDAEDDFNTSIHERSEMSVDGSDIGEKSLDTCNESNPVLRDDISEALLESNGSSFKEVDMQGKPVVTVDSSISYSVLDDEKGPDVFDILPGTQANLTPQASEDTSMPDYLLGEEGERAATPKEMSEKREARYDNILQILSQSGDVNESHAQGAQSDMPAVREVTRESFLSQEAEEAAPGCAAVEESIAIDQSRAIDDAIAENILPYSTDLLQESADQISKEERRAKDFETTLEESIPEIQSPSGCESTGSHELMEIQDVMECLIQEIEASAEQEPKPGSPGYDLLPPPVLIADPTDQPQIIRRKSLKALSGSSQLSANVSESGQRSPRFLGIHGSNMRQSSTESILVALKDGRSSQVIPMQTPSKRPSFDGEVTIRMMKGSNEDLTAIADKKGTESPDASPGVRKAHLFSTEGSKRNILNLHRKPTMSEDETNADHSTIISSVSSQPPSPLARNGGPAQISREGSHGTLNSMNSQSSVLTGRGSFVSLGSTGTKDLPIIDLSPSPPNPHAAVGRVSATMAPICISGSAAAEIVSLPSTTGTSHSVGYKMPRGSSASATSSMPTTALSRQTSNTEMQAELEAALTGDTDHNLEIAPPVKAVEDDLSIAEKILQMYCSKVLPDADSIQRDFWDDFGHCPAVVEAAIGFEDVYPTEPFVPQMTTDLRSKCTWFARLLLDEQQRYVELERRAQERDELVSGLDIGSEESVMNYFNGDHVERQLDMAYMLKARQLTDPIISQHQRPFHGLSCHSKSELEGEESPSKYKSGGENVPEDIYYMNSSGSILRMPSYTQGNGFLHQESVSSFNYVAGGNSFAFEQGSTSTAAPPMLTLNPSHHSSAESTKILTSLQHQNFSPSAAIKFIPKLSKSVGGQQIVSSILLSDDSEGYRKCKPLKKHLRERCAVMIQSAIRGHIARVKYHQMIAVNLQNAAATIIQCMVRRYLARKTRKRLRREFDLEMNFLRTMIFRQDKASNVVRRLIDRAWAARQRVKERARQEKMEEREQKRRAQREVQKAALQKYTMIADEKSRGIKAKVASQPNSPRASFVRSGPRWSHSDGAVREGGSREDRRRGPRRSVRTDGAQSPLDSPRRQSGTPANGLSRHASRASIKSPSFKLNDESRGSIKSPSFKFNDEVLKKLTSPSKESVCSQDADDEEKSAAVVTVDAAVLNNRRRSHTETENEVDILKVEEDDSSTEELDPLGAIRARLDNRRDAREKSYHHMSRVGIMLEGHAVEREGTSDSRRSDSRRPSRSPSRSASRPGSSRPRSGENSHMGSKSISRTGSGKEISAVDKELDEERKSAIMEHLEMVTQLVNQEMLEKEMHQKRASPIRHGQFGRLRASRLLPVRNRKIKSPGEEEEEEKPAQRTLAVTSQRVFLEPATAAKPQILHPNEVYIPPLLAQADALRKRRKFKKSLPKIRAGEESQSTSLADDSASYGYTIGQKLMPMSPEQNVRELLAKHNELVCHAFNLQKDAFVSLHPTVTDSPLDATCADLRKSGISKGENQRSGSAFDVLVPSKSIGNVIGSQIQVNSQKTPTMGMRSLLEQAYFTK